MIVTTPRSTEASSDKDDPKDSTTMTEESRGSRRDNAPERTLRMAEAVVCLRAKGIDNSGIGIGRGRQARGLSDNNGGVRGEQGIYDTY